MTTAAHDFSCADCGAKYKVVPVEMPVHAESKGEIGCLSCGASLRGRDGTFALKYFLVERPRRAKRSVSSA